MTRLSKKYVVLLLSDATSVFLNVLSISSFTLSLSLKILKKDKVNKVNTILCTPSLKTHGFQHIVHTHIASLK